MKSFTLIINDLRTFLRAAVPSINTSVGTVVRDLINAFGGELAEIYSYINATKDDAFLSTATGDELDQKAADFNIARIQAVKSLGTIWFMRETPAPQNYYIYAGVKVSTPQDEYTPAIVFLTAEDVAIEMGNQSTYAAIEAEFGGDEGNVAAYAIDNMPSPVVGVTSIGNYGPTTTGEDAESDEDLRNRVIGSISPLYSVAAIEAAAESTPGVFDAKVVDPQDGAGNFFVYACDIGGILASSLEDDVQVIVDAVKVVGTVANILGPSVVLVNVTGILYVLPEFSSASVQTGVETAINDFFESLEIGDNFDRYDLLVYISDNVAGVDNLVLAEPGTDVVATDYQICRLGSLSIGAA